MTQPAPSKPNRPVIIVRRKRKRTAERRHSGAWKVAYADFVTAMMAFFLLLWLLGVTTTEQRQGIARYFGPFDAASIDRDGILGGMTITLPGAMVSPGSPLLLDASAASSPQPEPASAPASPDTYDDGRADPFAATERRLIDAVGGIPDLARLSTSLVIDRVPEGLRIQLVDGADYSMFPLGSAELTPLAERLMAQVAKVIAPLPNRLSISGHTDATPYAGENAYGNWELSADRANASRRALVAHGIAEERIAEVVGRADRQHLLKDEPGSPRNRRISIVLLRDEPLPAPAPKDEGTPSRSPIALP